jgi:glutamate-1-semialdehyde aminotransferase
MRFVEKSVVSSTFGGDTISLAATKAVLDTYINEDVIGTLWERGQQLHDGFSEICQRLEIPAGFYGLPPTGLLLFTHQDKSRNDDLYQIFNAETLKRGIIIYNLCYPNYAHSTNDIDTALNAMKESLQSMNSAGLFD